MRLLIVGNGLDLALGYPTSLVDCGQWLKKMSKHNRYLRKRLNYINIFYRRKNLFGGNFNLWGNLEQNLTKVKWSLRHKSNKWPGDPWADIMKLFRFWVKIICSYVDNNGPKYENTLEYKLICNLCKQATFIISFNYTKTLENYFNVPNWKIIHIHIDPDNNQPVMGHAKMVKYPSNSACTIFDIGSTKITDDWLDAYKDVLSHICNVSEIYFLGLSYGKVDRPYYKELNELYTLTIEWPGRHFFSKSCSWIFYYHSLINVFQTCSFYNYLLNNHIVCKNLRSFNRHMYHDSNPNKRNLKSNAIIIRICFCYFNLRVLFNKMFYQIWKWFKQRI